MPLGNLTGGGTTTTRHTRKRERTHSSNVNVALWLAGGVVEGSKSLPAATFAGKMLGGALVPVKNILKWGRGQDKALGRGGCFLVLLRLCSVQMSKYSIWL